MESKSLILSSSAVNAMSAINNQCSGYSAMDIKVLCRDAALLCRRRKSKVVEDFDFFNVLQSRRHRNNVSAGAEIPDVCWSDVGGLESVKKSLKELVIWPYENASV